MNGSAVNIRAVTTARRKVKKKSLSGLCEGTQTFDKSLFLPPWDFPLKGTILVFALYDYYYF